MRPAVSGAGPSTAGRGRGWALRRRMTAGRGTRGPVDGTVRLILKAGVSVVPCGTPGCYAVWPRWSPRPEKGPVTVRFRAPLRLGRHDDRREREAALLGVLESRRLEPAQAEDVYADIREPAFRRAAARLMYLQYQDSDPQRAGRFAEQAGEAYVQAHQQSLLNLQK